MNVLIENQSVNHNTINTRGFLSLLKDKISHDDSNNSDDTINNTVSKQYQ